MKFDTLFLIFADFECSYIKLKFLHVTVKVGEGGGHPFRNLLLLFMFHVTISGRDFIIRTTSVSFPLDTNGLSHEVTLSHRTEG